MRQTMCLSLLAGAAVSLSGANVARAETEAWSSSERDEVRALVSEMVADAENRSSLLQSGGAGHDGKFFLASPDGNFRLNIGGQVQFRYTVNNRDGDDEDDAEVGFEARRTKVQFGGHIFDPNLYYFVKGDFGQSSDASETGEFILEDAYAGYQLDGGFKVQWGQYKLPILYEELVLSSRQLAADRSATNEFFNQGRSQAISLRYDSENFQANVAVSDGVRSANTTFFNAPSDIGLSGRVDFLAFGEWSQFEDFTSERGSEAGLRIGGAAHWEDGPDDNDFGLPEDNELVLYTIDAQYEADGWNLFGAFIGRSFDDGTDTFDDFGWLVQGGIYLTEEWELFGRFDQIIPDDDEPGVDEEEFSTITAGVNYYLYGHAAKFTLDFQWFLDQTEEAFGDPDAAFPTIGHLPSNEEDQFVVRAQFQILF